MDSCLCQLQENLCQLRRAVCYQQNSDNGFLIVLLVLCRLLPGVEDVAQNVADPECRSVASKAHATLLKVGADGKVTGIVANEAEVLAVLGSAVAKVDGQVGEVVVKYVASMMCGLINASQYKDEQWIEVCSSPDFAYHCCVVTNVGADSQPAYLCDILLACCLCADFKLHTAEFKLHTTAT